MFATPDDLGHVPVWRIYVFSQLTSACLRNISSRIVIVAFREIGVTVTLVFYVDPPLTDDYREIAQIMEDFDDLTGNLLDVHVEVKEWDPTTIDRGLIWTYRRWLGADALDTESSGQVEQLKVRRL